MNPHLPVLLPTLITFTLVACAYSSPLFITADGKSETSRVEVL
jgi:hypothetical protein